MFVRFFGPCCSVRASESEGGWVRVKVAEWERTELQRDEAASSAWTEACVF